AYVGDTVLVTKGVPLEGASIIARERGEDAIRRGVPADVVARAREFLRRPGISVVPEARAACAAARVHAMHDPTEGGLATACWELAQAAGVGLRVDRERVPVLAEGRRLCEAFGLDPLGTIASGALLLTVRRRGGARPWSLRVIRWPRWRGSRRSGRAAMSSTRPSPPTACSPSPSPISAAWGATSSACITRRRPDACTSSMARGARARAL